MPQFLIKPLNKTIKLFLLTSFFISCSSTEKGQVANLIPASKFSTKAKISMKDKKPLSANLDIVIAKREKKMRMEASTILGINLASIVLDNSHLSYYLHRTDEYYSGEATGLKLSLNEHSSNNKLVENTGLPLTFFQIKSLLNKEKPSDWNCTEENKTFIFCKAEDFDVTYQEKNKKLLIKVIDEEGAFELSLYVKKTNQNEMVREDIFIIPKP